MPRKMRKESSEDVAGALLVLQRMLQGVTQFRGGQIEREERGIEQANLERKFELSERGLSLREEEFGLREQKQTFATQAGLLEKFHEGGLRQIDPNTGQPMVLSEDREAALQLEFLELRGEKLQKEIDDFGKRTPTEDADLRLKKAKADRAVLELENLQKGLKADGSPIGEKDKDKAGLEIGKVPAIADPLKSPLTQGRLDTLKAVQAGEDLPQFETPEDTRSLIEKVLPDFLGGKPAPIPTKRIESPVTDVTETTFPLSQFETDVIDDIIEQGFTPDNITWNNIQTQLTQSGKDHDIEKIKSEFNRRFNK